MPRTKDEAQTALWDRTIESPELEAAIETIMEHRLPKEEQAAVNKARKVIKQVTEAHNLEDGQRLRVGRFVITGKARAGGGFEVPPWEKTTVGEITELDG